MHHRRVYLLVLSVVTCLALIATFAHRGVALAQSRSPAAVTAGGDLQVQVLKACQTCDLPAAPAPCRSTVFHRDQAAVWTPDRPIKIMAVSIPEQSEIALYTDIEVSTAAQMYLPTGHIFRVKYAGPGILQSPACAASFLGSNVTTTNITFPSGYGISVAAGTPVYVHMDVINWSPYEINPMAQDAYIYYVAAAGSQ